MNSDLYYKQKYLKYKNKYLTLKNMIGSGQRKRAQQRKRQESKNQDRINKEELIRLVLADTILQESISDKYITKFAKLEGDIYITDDNIYEDSNDNIGILIDLIKIYKVHHKIAFRLVKELNDNQIDLYMKILEQEKTKLPIELEERNRVLDDIKNKVKVLESNDIDDFINIIDTNKENKENKKYTDIYDEIIKSKSKQ